MDTEARDQNITDRELAHVTGLGAEYDALTEAGRRLREEAAEIMPTVGSWVRSGAKPDARPGMVVGVKGAKLLVEFPREHGANLYWLDARKLTRVSKPTPEHPFGEAVTV